MQFDSTGSLPSEGNAGKTGGWKKAVAFALLSGVERSTVRSSIDQSAFSLGFEKNALTSFPPGKHTQTATMIRAFYFFASLALASQVREREWSGHGIGERERDLFFA
jgi:hypothetical protein